MTATSAGPLRKGEQSPALLHTERLPPGDDVGNNGTAREQPLNSNSRTAASPSQVAAEPAAAVGSSGSSNRTIAAPAVVPASSPDAPPVRAAPRPGNAGGKGPQPLARQGSRVPATLPRAKKGVGTAESLLRLPAALLALPILGVAAVTYVLFRVRRGGSTAAAAATRRTDGVAKGSKAAPSKGRDATAGNGGTASGAASNGKRAAQKGRHKGKRGAAIMDTAQQDPTADGLAHEAGPATSEPMAPQFDPVAPDTLPVLRLECALPTAPASGPLAGLRLVVSESIDVAGQPTTFGGAPAHHRPATAEGSNGAVSSSEAAPGTTDPGTARANAELVQSLASAGVQLVGKAAMQPLSLDGGDLLGTNFGNPSNKLRVSGGGCTGAVVAVAAGTADVAVGLDYLGQLRVPAACCGVLSYRPSAFPVDASSSGAGSHMAGVVGMAARDASVLLRCAKEAGAPGNRELRGELIKFVVAEDMFALCGPELQPALVALKKSIIRWAGADQAGSVQLCSYLANHTSAWQDFQKGNAHNWRSTSSLLEQFGLGPVPEVLDAMCSAAAALQEAEISALFSAATTVKATASAVEAGPAPIATAADSVEAPPVLPGATPPSTDPGAAPAAAFATLPSGTTQGDGKAAVPSSAEAEPGPDASADTGAVLGQEQSSASTAATAEDAREPASPPFDRLGMACQLAREVFECLKTTVKPDTMMIIPALPLVPLRRSDADGLAGTVFARLAQCFCCLPTLAACPSVTIPVGRLLDGTPLSVTMFAVHKFDMRLLAVAQKLLPMVQSEFDAVKKELAQRYATAAAAAEAAKAPASKNTGGSAAEAAPTDVVNGKGTGRKGTKPKAKGAAGAKVTNASSAAGAASAAGGAPGLAGSTPGAGAPADPRRVERAEKHKARGNELFKTGKYAEAVNEYGRAIAELPTAVYYNNRAMANLKIFRFEQAEEDCDRALKLELREADRVKALLRRATARTALDKFSPAEADLKLVLNLEPNNRQARDDLAELRTRREEMQAAQIRMVQEYRAAAAAAAAHQQGGSGSGGGATSSEAPYADTGGVLGGFPGMLPPDTEQEEGDGSAVQQYDDGYEYVDENGHPIPPELALKMLAASGGRPGPY